MSKGITQTQIPATPKRKQHEPSYDEHMTWRARWFLIRLIPILYGASLLSGGIVYWLTKDAHYLLLASPTLFTYHTIRYLLPMDDKRFELEKLKIQAKAQRRARKGS